MHVYPKGWHRSDVAAAVATLTAAGVAVTGSETRRPARHVEFVMDGRVCRLVERTPEDRPVWLAMEFPWPAAWPDLMLTDEGDPYEQECADPAPPAGYALSSHDLPRARAVVDAGYADAARQPRAELSIEEFDAAMLTAGPNVALNGETAGWLLGLLRTALAAAPAVNPADDVAGRVHPGYLGSDAQVHGTAAEVLHRLLWLQTVAWVDTDTTSSPATARLRAALDGWIDTAARLAADSRDPAADHPAVRGQVRQLAGDIELAVEGTEYGDANENLVLRLRHVVTEVRRWDVPTNLQTAVTQTADQTPRRRWFRRS